MNDRIVICDLEATCWDKGEHNPEKMEIIEIGAVLADAKSMRKLDEFNSFVRPVRNPVLSDFCVNLTSIQQQDVDDADVFPIVFSRFLDWIGDLETMRIASWGAYDLNQFKQNCRFHGIANPFRDKHINLKKKFSELHNGKKYGMKRAMRIVGLVLEGVHHRGIDDARNIFRICEKVPEIMVVFE
jgi:3'-5' exoribonuclease 1